MRYTLGLDIGTNSIGWCVLALNGSLEPISVAKMEVRIFSDSREDKTPIPLAVARRNARGIRRNLDRRRYKTGTLLRKLVALGFMPQDELERKNLATIDPYLIRSQAIREKVSLEHIARALIHISKHRGFKSNRKADKKSKDDGKMGMAIMRLKEQLLLAKCETIGEFLYQKKKNRETVRTRLGRVEVENNKAEGKVTVKDGYEWYIERSMVKHEFDTIMQCQKKYHKELTDEAINLLDKVIFSQRPLKPMIVGICSQYTDKYRVSKALPISQEFIMLQKIHDLRINEYDHQRPLTEVEFEKLKNELNKCTEKGFKQIRKLLGIENEFNFENEKNKKLQGNITNAIMADKKRFGEAWYKFSDEKKNDIVETLISDKSDDELVKYFQSLNLADDKVENILSSGFKALPDGYMSYCKEAITELTQLMRVYGKSFYDAKLELCYDDNIRSEKLDNLPEYTEILYKYCAENFKGEKRIGNPTVHVALNQLNKVVNAIIGKYGKPQNIVVEIGRELKMTETEKKDLGKKQEDNKEIKNKWIKEFSDTKLSYDDIQKLKLWEELPSDSRVCIFCGDPIERSMILTESIEIEHILPFSRTFDNGLANKVLSHRSCNGYKGNRTPYEAFAHSSEFKYDDILRRASLLPKNKKWRFNKDAMEKFKDENGFLARQLTDMQYISKIAVEYLACLYSKDEASKILGIPGRLTSMFRDKLGLNKILSDDSKKNRNDHRHHAIDALVVALTTRSLLQKVSTLSAKYENLYTGKTNKLFEKLEQPWPTFHKSVERAAGDIKVSHKLEHGLQGRLHEDTAYGIVEPAEMGANLVVRKALESLTPKEISMIRDKSIRIKVEELRDKSDTEQEFKQRLTQFIKETDIKRVRVLKKDLPVAILTQNGKAYKALVGGDNLCVEIFKKESGEIDKEVIEKFHANQKGFAPKWMKTYPNAELIMRLYKGDIVKLNIGGLNKLMILKSVGINQLVFSGIMESGKVNLFSPVYNTLSDKYNLRHVYIDLLGNVKKATKPCAHLWSCGGVCNPKNCGKVNS